MGAFVRHMILPVYPRLTALRPVNPCVPANPHLKTTSDTVMKLSVKNSDLLKTTPSTSYTGSDLSVFWEYVACRAKLDQLNPVFARPMA